LNPKNRSESIGGEDPFDGSGWCYVSSDHIGPCTLYYSSVDEGWAIFPSREIALNAAWAACKYNLGGYAYVEVRPLSSAPKGTSEYGSSEAWLFDGQGIFDDPLEQTGVGAIARRFMRELVKQIAASPWELAAVEWRDLERLLFEVFVALGFNAKLTRSSKDGGYDFRLEAEGYVYFG
jgi:hypothetical protein